MGDDGVNFRTFVAPEAREDVAVLSYAARMLHDDSVAMVGEHKGDIREQGDRHFLRTRKELAGCVRQIVRRIEEARVAHVVNVFEREELLPPSAADTAGTNDCALCLEPVREGTDSVRATCCGNLQCKKCSKQLIRHQMKVAVDWLHRNDENFEDLDREEKQRKVTEHFRSTATCIVCRQKVILSEMQSLRKNAEKGHAWAQQLLSATLLKRGEVEEGICWLAKAVEQEYTIAQTQFATYLLNGMQGVPEGDQESVREVALVLIKHAAYKGDPTAQGFLGECYIDGDSTLDLSKQENESVKFLTLSASQGIPSSQFRLAKIWCEGESVQEKERGMYWLSKAASQGHAEAQCYLAKGLLVSAEYYFGRPDWPGYSQIPASIQWAKTAVANGCEEGGQLLIFLESRNLSTCSVCKTSKADCYTFFLCPTCQASGYCSNLCKKNHWKVGHSIDCCCGVFESDRSGV